MTADWPPETTDLWLVHGTMGAPIGAMDQDGAGRFVLLRMASRRNHGTDEDDRTYVLGLEETASILSGIIECGNRAFGRDAMVDAMAQALGMTDADRRLAAETAAARLRGDR